MLNLPVNLPAEKLRMVDEIVEAFRHVPNIVAVVLGGSYARGFARPDSDVDIGIYYRESAPFSVDRIQSVADRICTPGSLPIVTETYGWGPWVNGGAWIQTPAGEVDFVYRNLDQVRRVIEEGCQGIWRHDYDQQPPYGFRSVVYFGETSTCVPLYDPEGEILELKKSVAVYPGALKKRIVQESLWGAEFSLWYCRTYGTDVYLAAGCLVRFAQFLVQALFALNEEYFVSDKDARRVDQFALHPNDFTSRLALVLSKPGSNTDELHAASELMHTLLRETVELTAGAYVPRYDL